MIEVEHLSKVYGSTTALQDVSFAAQPGEILGLLGPNGAGKTTTMRILAGYLPATKGTASVAGFEVHENPMAVRQRIGYLPEVPPLYPNMTVEGYLHFVGRLKGLSAGDRPQRVQWAMEQCNLQDVQKTLIHKLSKGFRQRVGIAQAIVHNPPAIILDEPTIGLDPRQIIDVRNLIKSLAADKTVILSTHILPEVNMTCQRVAIINNGKVVATNTLADLKAQQTEQLIYELDVQGDLDSVEHSLQSLEGVLTWQWLSAQPSERRKVRVTCNPDPQVGQQLTHTLVHAGVAMYEMRRLGTSLEEIYLELTTKEDVDTSTESEIDPAELPVSDANRHPTPSSEEADPLNAEDLS
ncbi:ABC transporter ATP-binding protein [Acaryochloris sp. CCMEE 5410]|uniref:ABC transporter ATP-binding protein n=1 Tax=Acaryochloris sp. CCMEE 5410 TaxID=310037 RepID=UPI0002484FDA|nr:ABC transporter ATP-binding protein [Acaryochloris sp. CCMEE 5410]KAI9134709.1 ABC transporter ATP-binding protein [Acaryochloris sp. CCMEE 5410]